MSDKVIAAIIVALCLVMIVVDFTSKMMSIAVDGVVGTCVIYLVYRLVSGKATNQKPPKW